MRDCDWMIEKSTLVRKVYKICHFSFQDISRGTSQITLWNCLWLKDGPVSSSSYYLYIKPRQGTVHNILAINVQPSFLNKKQVNLHNCAFSWVRLSLTLIRLARPCQWSRHSTLECRRGRKLTFSKIISPGWNLDLIKSHSLSTTLVTRDPSRSLRFLWHLTRQWGSIFKPREWRPSVGGPQWSSERNISIDLGK